MHIGYNISMVKKGGKVMPIPLPDFKPLDADGLAALNKKGDVYIQSRLDDLTILLDNYTKAVYESIRSPYLKGFLTYNEEYGTHPEVFSSFSQHVKGYLDEHKGERVVHQIGTRLMVPLREDIDDSLKKNKENILVGLGAETLRDFGKMFSFYLNPNLSTFSSQPGSPAPPESLLNEAFIPSLKKLERSMNELKALLTNSEIFYGTADSLHIDRRPLLNEEELKAREANSFFLKHFPEIRVDEAGNWVVHPSQADPRDPVQGQFAATKECLVICDIAAEMLQLASFAIDHRLKLVEEQQQQQRNVAAPKPKVDKPLTREDIIEDVDAEIVADSKRRSKTPEGRILPSADRGGVAATPPPEEPTPPNVERGVVAIPIARHTGTLGPDTPDTSIDFATRRVVPKEATHIAVSAGIVIPAVETPTPVSGHDFKAREPERKLGEDGEDNIGSIRITGRNRIVTPPPRVQAMLKQSLKQTPWFSGGVPTFNVEAQAQLEAAAEKRRVHR